MSGKVHQDCPNKNNPFHECNDRCFERISSGDILKKERKKTFGFGWIKVTPPSSPARVIAGYKSPFPRVVESDVSPSFSSSDDTFNENLSTPRSPQNGNKAEIGWLPMSPSLSDYCKKDYLASKLNDHREGEGEEAPMSPRIRPKTPEHPLRRPKHKPRTPDSRPRTPERESTVIGPRPREPDTRPRTPERRAKSPEYKAISPRQHSKSREPHARTHEPHRPRISQTQPISHKSLDNASPKSPRTVETQPVSHRSLDSGHGLKSPLKNKTRPQTQETKAKTLESLLKGEEYQASSPNHRTRSPRPGSRSPQTQPNYHSFAQASKYLQQEEECVILDPEFLLSPERSPSSRSITPKKHQEFDHRLDEPESIDIDDNFSYLDDHDDDSSYLYPEIKKPLNQRSSISSNEPPEIGRTKALKIYETEEETESMIISESSYVSVRSYKIRDTLKQILDKHGDIASGSKLQSRTTRSNALETLATVVLELQSTPLKELKEMRVLEMLKVVKDVESVKIRVGWLKEVLNEILEAVKHYNGHKTTVMEKEVCERDTSLGRQEMEKVMKEVRLKEKEVKEFRKGVMETAGRLGELEMKRARLEKSLAFLSSKIDKFVGKSVLENVL